MEHNLKNLNDIFTNCQNEIRQASSSETGMEDIVRMAKKYIKECADELDAARSLLAAEEEQLALIRQAKEASEQNAANAAAEENDARIAAEMAQKMLDDAAMVHSIANKDTASILIKAANVLQDTIRTANAFYQQKVKQREELDLATVRLLATQKALEYNTAKSSTDEAVKIKQLVIAEQIAEIEEAEQEVVRLLNSIEQLQAAQSMADYDAKLVALRAELAELNENLASYAQAEKNEKDNADKYLADRKRQDEEHLNALRQDKQAFLDLQQRKAGELANANEKAVKNSEKAKTAFADAGSTADSVEEAINHANAERKKSLDNLEATVEAIRADIADKKLQYLQAGEKWSAAIARCDDLKQQLKNLQGKANIAAEEEDSTREAAEVARRLADNAVKVRLSISAESADLLLQAQEVLSEAAAAAEELREKKYTQRMEIEKHCQEVKFNMEQAEYEANEAEAATSKAKQVWEREEERLAEEMASADQAKKEYSASFDLKVKEQEQKLLDAQQKSEQAQKEADAVFAGIRALEAELSDLDDNINRLEKEIAETSESYQQAFSEYAAASQTRMQEISVMHNQTAAQAEQVQQQLTDYEQNLSEITAKEDELAVRLSAAQAHVQSLLAAALGQGEAAEAEIETRRLAEEVAQKAADEVAEYVGAITVSAISEEILHAEEELPEAALVEEATTDLQGEEIFAAVEAAIADQQLEEAEPEAVDDSAAESSEPLSESVAAENENEINFTEDQLIDEESLVDVLADDDSLADEAGEAAAIEEAGNEIDAEAAIAEESEEASSRQEEVDLVSAAAEEEPAFEQETAAMVEEIPIAGYGANDDEYGVRITSVVVETSEAEETADGDSADRDNENAEIIDEEAAPDEAENMPEPAAAPAIDEQIEETFPPEEQEAVAELSSKEEEIVETEQAEDAAAKDEAERKRAEEEEEEAEILAGLTGSIPQFDKTAEDENAEYTAWLDIISSDIIEKMMSNEESIGAANDNNGDVDNWLSNLEKSFNEEDNANRHPLVETEKKEDTQAATESEKEEPSQEQGADKASADDNKKDKNKKDKKKKRSPFRFF